MTPLPQNTPYLCRHPVQQTGTTTQRLKPRLPVLDPLVRLHGVDENAVAEIAPILGFLRDSQGGFETAVLLVHHARRSGATRPGQALRGSSELHAWGDSNLYLRRRDKQIVMTVEHRAAPGLNDIEIELADDGQGPAFRLRRAVPDEVASKPETPEQRVARCSRTPKPRSPNARSASAPQPGTRPSAPSSESCSAKVALSVTPRAGTASSEPGTVPRRRRSRTKPPNRQWVKRSARGRKLAYGHGSTPSRGRRRSPEGP